MGAHSRTISDNSPFKQGKDGRFELEALNDHADLRTILNKLVLICQQMQFLTTISFLRKNTRFKKDFNKGTQTKLHVKRNDVHRIYEKS